MFDELEELDPEHFAVRQYAKFKLAQVPPLLYMLNFINNNLQEKKQEKLIILSIPSLTKASMTSNTTSSIAAPPSP
jgi:hypothetical protein